MPITRRVIALFTAAIAAVPACKPRTAANAQDSKPVVRAEEAIRLDERVIAGGVVPPANALSAPRPTNLSPDAGANLFSAMNCDGCHGGGAVGWVGPSLVDGRWRYGGTDEEIFTSIFYGRPKGMPAYGGVIGTDGVWMLVAYIKAQAVPPVVPTTSWLPGGNAAPTPPAPAAAAAPSPAAAAPAAPSAQALGPPDQLVAKYGCTACHAVDHKVVGPSFKDVAAKYRGKDVETTLAEKIRKGGSGVWGDIPMIPNPSVPEPELDAMVKWILALQ
jgi:cytochrome c551/c552